MKSHASELAVGIFVILFGIALFFIAMRVSGWWDQISVIAMK